MSRCIYSFISQNFKDLINNYRTTAAEHSLLPCTVFWYHDVIIWHSCDTHVTLMWHSCASLCDVFLILKSIRVMLLCDTIDPVTVCLFSQSHAPLTPIRSGEWVHCVFGRRVRIAVRCDVTTHHTPHYTHHIPQTYTYTPSHTYMHTFWMES